MSDFFSDPGETEKDLFTQESVLWARSILPTRLIQNCLSEDPGVLEMLRASAMQHFCEFFYVLRARSIRTADDIRTYAELHNAYLDTLTRDQAKMKRLGLRSDRLLDAIFTSDSLPRLIDTWQSRPGTIDQSNLARFLSTVMSAETCRKLVIAASVAGFLERSKSPYGTALLTSTGVMEQIFGGILRDLRLRIVGSSG